MSNGRVCANANCHHTEDQHVNDMCWGKPKKIRKDGPTPGCRCNGFVARRDTTVLPTEHRPKGRQMSYQEDRDEAENRFATAFERIAGALERLAATQEAYFLRVNTVPSTFPVPAQPYPLVCHSPKP